MTFFRLDGVAVVGAGGGDGWVSSDNIIVSFLAYDRVDGMVKGLVKVKRFYVLRSASYGVDTICKANVSAEPYVGYCSSYVGVLSGKTTDERTKR